MSLEAAFREHVLSDAQVAAMITDRMSPVTLPRSPQYPCVRYTVVSKVRDLAFSGYTGLCLSRLQVDVFSGEYDVAKRVAGRIKARLIGLAGAPAPWPGNMGTSSPIEVQAVFVDGDGDGYEGADDGFDSATEAPLGVYSCSADYLVWYKEPAPT